MSTATARNPASDERSQLVVPGPPEFRKSVQEQHEWAGPGLDDVKAVAVGAHEPVRPGSVDQDEAVVDPGARVRSWHKRRASRPLRTVGQFVSGTTLSDWRHSPIRLGRRRPPAPAAGRFIVCPVARPDRGTYAGTATGRPVNSDAPLWPWVQRPLLLFRLAGLQALRDQVHDGRVLQRRYVAQLPILRHVAQQAPHDLA